MGRGRIEIKKIDNLNSRQVTFSKRRNGLMKKARELAVLCDAEVSVIIFSGTGKLYEFSSKSMEHTLARYNNGGVELENNGLTLDHHIHQHGVEEVAALRQEMERLQRSYRQMMGKEIDGLSFKELHKLEGQLAQGLSCVKEKKVESVFDELNKSKLQEQRFMEENESLRKEIEELRRAKSSSCVELIMNPSSTSWKAAASASASARTATASSSSEEDLSDTSLQLRLSSHYLGNKNKKKKLFSCSNGSAHSTTTTTTTQVASQ